MQDDKLWKPTQAPDTHAKKREAPAKRWRNKFKSRHEAAVLGVDSMPTTRGPGIFYGPNVHPTQALAEEMARKTMEYKNGAWARLYGVEYIGAFPVDE